MSARTNSPMSPDSAPGTQASTATQDTTAPQVRATPLGVGSRRSKTDLRTPLGLLPPFKYEENRLAVSVLMGSEHRRTARPLADLATKFGLTPEAAAMALIKTISDMQEALGSYVRTLDTPLPGPVSKSVRKKGSPGP